MGRLTNLLAESGTRIRGHFPMPAKIFCSQRKWEETVLQFSAHFEHKEKYQTLFLSREDVDKALPKVLAAASPKVQRKAVCDLLSNMDSGEFLSLVHRVLSSTKVKRNWMSISEKRQV